MGSRDIVIGNGKRGTYEVPKPSMYNDDAPLRNFSFNTKDTVLRGTWLHDQGSNSKGDSYNFSWTSNNFTVKNQGNLFSAESSSSGWGYSSNTLTKEDHGVFYGEPNTNSNSNSERQSTTCRYIRCAVGLQTAWSAPDNTNSDKTEPLYIQDLGFVYNRIDDDKLYYAAMIYANSWTGHHDTMGTSPLNGHKGTPTNHAGKFHCSIPDSAIATIKAAEATGNPYYLTALYMATKVAKDGVIRTKSIRFDRFKILTEKHGEEHPSNFRYVYPGHTSWDDIKRYSRSYLRIQN